MAYLHGLSPGTTGVLSPPMVHANLKSAKLLLDQGWRVKVADANVQQLFDVDGSAASTISAMNPQYMAPEQWEGWRTVPASDVYAFGVILWVRPPSSSAHAAWHRAVAPQFRLIVWPTIN